MSKLSFLFLALVSCAMHGVEKTNREIVLFLQLNKPFCMPSITQKLIPNLLGSTLKDSLDFLMRGTWSPNSTAWYPKGLRELAFTFEKKAIVTDEERTRIVKIFNETLGEVFDRYENAKDMMKIFCFSRALELSDYLFRKKTEKGVQASVAKNIEFLGAALAPFFTTKELGQVLEPFNGLRS